jgi:hypothetical protein
MDVIEYKYKVDAGTQNENYMHRRKMRHYGTMVHFGAHYARFGRWKRGPTLCASLPE